MIYTQAIAEKNISFLEKVKEQANLENIYEGRELFENLTQSFKQALKRELQNKETQSELQSLLSELLEELKINYVQNSSQQDPTITLSEVEQMQSSSP